MMVDTTIYGYVTEGAIVCTGCLDPTEEMLAYGGGVSPLYYLDDEDPHGTTCGDCGGFIFEPVEPHPYDENAPDHLPACDYGCNGYCGEGAACHLHVEDAESE